MIFGAKYDESMKDTCTVTVIATGINDGLQVGFNNTGFKSGTRPMFTTPINSVNRNVNQGGMNNMTQQPAQVPVQPAQPTRPTIQVSQPTHRPVDLKSNVGEKNLVIPDFLRKNN